MAKQNKIQIFSYKEFEKYMQKILKQKKMEYKMRSRKNKNKNLKIYIIKFN